MPAPGCASSASQSGDRVGGLALNSFRHLEACMGVPTTNLVLNDLNFRLALPELEFIVNDSGARVLLADERHWETADRAARPLRLRSSSWSG